MKNFVITLLSLPILPYKRYKQRKVLQAEEASKVAVELLDQQVRAETLNELTLFVSRFLKPAKKRGIRDLEEFEEELFDIYELTEDEILEFEKMCVYYPFCGYYEPVQETVDVLESKTNIEAKTSVIKKFDEYVERLNSKKVGTDSPVLNSDKLKDKKINNIVPSIL